MVFQDADFLKTFFSLLRSGMYGTPIPESELPESIDWKAILRLAKKHVVVGIVIDSVESLPERLRPSDSISAKLDKFALELIQKSIILDKTAARLVTFLKQHGFDGVLLKGQGVARSYYRMPQMRQSGDIDFYVGQSNYQKVADLCIGKLTDDKETFHETDKHFDFKLSGVTIELHRYASRIYTPLWNRRFQKWCVEELEHSRSRRTHDIGNADITLPSFDFDAIFIFCHAWYHYVMGGIGLRHVCDWAMIFHSHGDDLDKEALAKNINRFGLTNGWKLFACIAVRYLGIPADRIPLYDKAYHKKSEKILEKILVGGNFGYYSKDYTGIPVGRRNFWHGLGVFRKITGQFISIFTLIPIEASFIYLNRTFYGIANYIELFKKSIRKSAN